MAALLEGSSTIITSISADIFDAKTDVRIRTRNPVTKMAITMEVARSHQPHLAQENLG